MENIVEESMNTGVERMTNPRGPNMEEAQTASQHQTETVQTDNVVAAVPTDGARAGATDPDPAALEQARHEDDAAKKARVDQTSGERAS